MPSKGQNFYGLVVKKFDDLLKVNTCFCTNLRQSAIFFAGLKNTANCIKSVEVVISFTTIMQVRSLFGGQQWWTKDFQNMKLFCMPIWILRLPILSLVNKREMQGRVSFNCNGSSIKGVTQGPKVELVITRKFGTSSNCDENEWETLG